MEQVEVLARKHRIAIDKKLFGDIDNAFKHRDMGAVLVCTADARQYASDILASALAEAEGWARQFDIPEAKEIVAGRQWQQLELAGLFPAVQRGIVTCQQGQSSHQWFGLFLIHT